MVKRVSCRVICSDFLDAEEAKTFCAKRLVSGISEKRGVTAWSYRKRIVDIIENRFVGGWQVKDFSAGGLLDCYV